MEEKTKRGDIFDNIKICEIDFDVGHIVCKDGPGFIIKEKVGKFLVITGRRDFKSFPDREPRYNYHTLIADSSIETSGDVVPLIFQNLYATKLTNKLSEALKWHFSTIKFLSSI